LIPLDFDKFEVPSKIGGPALTIGG